ADAVSGIIGPHSDRLTGRDNKDELLVADHRSITMNHLNQNGTIALLQPTASLLRSTGGGTGAGAGAAGPGTSGVIAGGSGLATTATTRFYNRLSSGNNTANNNGNYHNNTAKHTSATGSKTGPSVSGLLGIHRKGGGKEVSVCVVLFSHFVYPTLSAAQVCDS
uniref:Uncharacterized protein n=1 Tax=Anopheles merus TaxID=30066 RepID=A0A182V698_ANOME